MLDAEIGDQSATDGWHSPVGCRPVADQPRARPTGRAGGPTDCRRLSPRLHLVWRHERRQPTTRGDRRIAGWQRGATGAPAPLHPVTRHRRDRAQGVRARRRRGHGGRPGTGTHVVSAAAGQVPRHGHSAGGPVADRRAGVGRLPRDGSQRARPFRPALFVRATARAALPIPIWPSCGRASRWPTL